MASGNSCYIKGTYVLRVSILKKSLVYLSIDVFLCSTILGRGGGGVPAEKINTGVCLVVAVGLTQDLTLILSTKKHQTKQNKERKQNPSKNSSTGRESGEGFTVMDICFIVMDICRVLLPATTSLKIPCHGEGEYMLCLTACQPHCEEDIVVYF